MSPTRVKIGGLDSNDEDRRDTWLLVIVPTFPIDSHNQYFITLQIDIITVVLALAPNH